MRPLRPLLAAAAVLAALPAAASAAPPPNDHYLASTTIQTSGGSLEYANSVDTSDATTQADTFDPNRDGLPFGGGDPEPTSCDGTSFGRTAWWDFRPVRPGGVELTASGGFDVVVAVYEWSAQTARITRTVVCQNAAPGSETVLLPSVRMGTDYTIQVGGVGNTGGPLKFSLSYFPDRDGDGVLDDEPDKCRTRPGIRRFGGCPPELRSSPRIRYDAVAGGIRVTSLEVDDVPKGARAEVRCRRCGSRVVRRARRGGVLSLRGFVGRVVRNGDRIEIRVSQGRRGRGRYRYGAVGRYVRWPIVAGGLGDKVNRCMQPGSRRPVRCG